MNRNDSANRPIDPLDDDDDVIGLRADGRVIRAGLVFKMPDFSRSDTTATDKDSNHDEQD